MTRPGDDRGLSLIELVVAMAIFALVAIMGAQALTGMLRMRDGVTERARETAALAEATSLLRADLAAAVPVFFRPPDGSRQSAIDFRDGSLSLSVAGQPSLRAEAGSQALTRVEWRLQDGRLTRRVWPALYPARAASLGPEQLVYKGIEGLRLRSYVADIGWIEGTPLPGQDTAASFDEDRFVAPSSYSDNLPLAVEVTLQTRAFGDIPLLESFR
ncbi:type II secretion system protein GspJ [Tropicibacter oceani]|uniref:Type II secretion system protein J n=1 Tax=Tropicibacter oceani TaxID=3058420 RepID=A0ABY8QPP2_9RHOB|nr:type II secretion system protein GspJ [Tropicibacter oceani]WGW05913.1 type II secretion system protein GspJ [Tropicibacter oceani]